MKTTPQVGVALVAGYVLGRRRRLRTALLLGMAAGSGRLGSASAGLARRGGEALGGSDLLGNAAPQLAEVSNLLRGELLDAVRDAVAAAASRNVDAFSDRLRDRAELIRNPRPRDVDENAAEDEDDYADDEEPEDEDYPEDEEPENEEPEDEDEGYPEDFEDEDEDQGRDEAAEDEAAPKGRGGGRGGRTAARSRSGRGTGKESPIRRTGR